MITKMSKSDYETIKQSQWAQILYGSRPEGQKYQKFKDENENIVHTQQQIQDRNTDIRRNSYPAPAPPEEQAKEPPKPFVERKTIDMATGFNLAAQRQQKTLSMSAMRLHPPGPGGIDPLGKGTAASQVLQSHSYKNSYSNAISRRVSVADMEPVNQGAALLDVPSSAPGHFATKAKRQSLADSTKRLGNMAMRINVQSEASSTANLALYGAHSSAVYAGVPPNLRHSQQIDAGGLLESSSTNLFND